VQEHLVLGAILAAIVVPPVPRHCTEHDHPCDRDPRIDRRRVCPLYAVGFTLNMMTLLALALAVGIVIDDAIVVLENHGGLGPRGCRQGGRRVAEPGAFARACQEQKRAADRWAQEAQGMAAQSTTPARRSRAQVPSQAPHGCFTG
jgi:hypothetical protein